MDLLTYFTVVLELVIDMYGLRSGPKSNLQPWHGCHIN